MLADIKGPQLDFFWGVSTAFNTALHPLAFNDAVASKTRRLGFLKKTYLKIGNDCRRKCFRKLKR